MNGSKGNKINLIFLGLTCLASKGTILYIFRGFCKVSKCLGIWLLRIMGLWRKEGVLLGIFKTYTLSLQQIHSFTI